MINCPYKCGKAICLNIYTYVLLQLIFYISKNEYYQRLLSLLRKIVTQDTNY